MEMKIEKQLPKNVGLFFNMEIRPLLKTANVTVCSRNKDCAFRVLKLNVGTTFIYLHVKFSEDEKKYTLNFPFNFLPDSLSCLSCIKNHISFRLQIKEKLSLEQRNIKTESNIKSNCAYVSTCMFCRTNLLKPETTFQRAIPIPPDWALDLTSEWFCHSHGNDDFDLNSKLQPNEKELFEGEDYILINIYVTDSSKLELTDTDLHCRRCFHVVGKIDSENSQVIHLFKHAVRFQQEELSNTAKAVENHLNENLIENELWASLLSRYNNMTTRIIIQHPSEKMDVSNVVLLWLVDVGIKQFMVDMKEETQISAELKDSWKIFYSLEKNSSKLVKEWKSNSSTEILNLNTDKFLYFVNSLMEKTASLPNIMQKIDTFWIAYI